MPPTLHPSATPSTSSPVAAAPRRPAGRPALVFAAALAVLVALAPASPALAARDAAAALPQAGSTAEADATGTSAEAATAAADGAWESEAPEPGGAPSHRVSLQDDLGGRIPRSPAPPPSVNEA